MSRSATSWSARRAAIARRLGAAGFDSAEAEARWLTETASGHRDAEWLTVAASEPTDRQQADLDSMVRRRLAGEPLQYVLGAWEFRGLDLFVDDRVLIPRPETELVVEVALEAAVHAGLRRGGRPALDGSTHAVVADLGTGSGAIALALAAELPDALVWATDVSRDALAVATANIAGCGATRVRTAHGSWFGALAVELRGALALVVVNPPYVAESEVASLPPEVAHHEPRVALVSGTTGLEAIDVIVRDAPRWLAPGGALVVEIAPHQAGAATARATAAGLAEVTVRDDLARRPRALVAHRPRTGPG